MLGIATRGRGAVRALVLGALVTGAIAALAPSVSAETGRASAGAAALVISGHGFGHGIGLSQWGAERRAAAGQPYEEILSFYYPGTRLGSVPDPRVRVLIADEPRVQVGSRSTFTVRDAGGSVLRLSPGRYSLAGGRIGSSTVRLPAQVQPGAEPIEVDGTRYHGTLTLLESATGVRVVNALDLEQYLVDVVSSENPGYWPQAALRAQAVASRSYAVANLNPDADFDVYPDDRSQNYHGMAKEFPSAKAAVDATAHQALLYGGTPIEAFFSASNGGLTSPADGVWGGASVPYLVSRPDGFDAASPDADWGPVVKGVAELRAAFPGLPATIAAVTVTRNSAERALTLTFVGTDGSNYSVSGSDFQTRLGLRSTYLSIAVTPFG